MEPVEYPTVLVVSVTVLTIATLLTMYRHRRLKAFVVKTWNRCLPNFIDFRVRTHLGPLYFSLIEIETDCEDMNYRPRVEPYLPRIGLLTFQWEKAKHSHFRPERSLIGYQLNTFPGILFGDRVKPYLK